MRAMVMEHVGRPLVERDVPEPEPGPGQVLVGVHACGVCRTDLHVLDGDLPDPKLPLVLGHQVAGEVVGAADGAERLAAGDRVGIPWLGWACGECRYCLSGRENLCPLAKFTGYQLDGGYAELAVADERFCLPLPDGYVDPDVAPLLCAGLIGYRALRMCGGPATLGLYGFGASAHIVCQLAVHEGRRVFALTRPGDSEGQEFARELGAEWAGDSAVGPPEPLDAAIVFAPVGALVTVALRALAPGGTWSAPGST
jgi:propanol-preferring alcohol dehydrogenase